MANLNTFSHAGMAAIAGAFVVGLGAIVTAAPASAEAARLTHGDPFSFRFTYTKSELETPEGAHKLLTRLETAVRRECAPPVAMLGKRERELVDSCIRTTMRQTIENLGSATVAQAFETRVAG
jgi:UrcA family protein